ncbi:MAG: SDR family oxidoreductase [Candidatus Neomarinimicrobiota bacterium]
MKTILITGATSGFGTACAIRFAEAGWRLILIGRREERLTALKQQLESKTPVLTIKLDVRDRQPVTEILSKIPEPFSAIDVLVNNAGLALGLTQSATADLDDWDTMIDTNIKGLVYCTRAILPGMVERNSGHIVNIGSIAGNWPYAGGNVYGATKAFVKQFSHNLRADLFGTNVRVTNIEPGLAETEFSIVRFKGDEEKAKKVYENIKPLTAEDIAECVFWAVNLPDRVNVSRIEVMPTCQAAGGLMVSKDKK